MWALRSGETQAQNPAPRGLEALGGNSEIKRVTNNPASQHTRTCLPSCGGCRDLNALSSSSQHQGEGPGVR
jgi:hypothetical protein